VLFVVVLASSSSAAAAPFADAGIWTPVDSPSPGHGVFNALLSGVSATAVDDAWAVGLRSAKAVDRTLAIHWDGGAWSAITTPNVGAGANTLVDVEAIAPADAWAVGQSSDEAGDLSTTLAMHWDGGRWKTVKTPNLSTSFGAYNILNAVVALSPTDVWAAGWSSNPDLNTIQLLFMHWNGMKWRLAASPTPLGAFQFVNGLAAVTSDDVWAVGFDESFSPSSTLAAHWNGRRWRIIRTPGGLGGDEQLHAVAALGTDDVWAVGDDLTGGPATTTPFAEHWDGHDWTRVPVPTARGNGRLFGVAALADGHVWAVGETANPVTGTQFTLTERWDGSAWRFVRSPNVGHQNTLLAAGALDPSTVWAVGAHDPDVGCCFRTLVLRTTQG
jgi:hypothetical protein